MVWGFGAAGQGVVDAGWRGVWFVDQSFILLNICVV